MDGTTLIELSYIVSAVLFIYGIKMLSSVATARPRTTSSARSTVSSMPKSS